VDGSGNLVAGGIFTTAGGVRARRIARWNGSTWSALGSGINGNVYALAVDGSGNLVAGGSFTTAGGVRANGIARWNGSAWRKLGSGLDGDVSALAVDGRGNLYAKGSFTNAGGVRSNGIARWNGSAWSALGSGLDGYISALVVSGNKLFVGGDFNGAVSGPLSFSVIQANLPTPTPKTQDVLKLAMNGTGTVSPAMGGKSLVIGNSYTLTARPGRGQVFLEWRKNGQPVSNGATLDFVMEEGLELEPVFVASPFPALAGFYNGLLAESGGGNFGTLQPGELTSRRGAFTFTVSASGAVSGRIQYEGATHALKGQMNGHGQIAIAVARRGKDSLTVDLEAVPAADVSSQPTLAVNVSVNGASPLTMEGEAPRAEYTGARGSLHPLNKARYTIALAPGSRNDMGNGYGLLRIDSKGQATLSGKLADGTAYTVSMRLNLGAADLTGRPWVLPVYAGLYGRFNGLLFGEIGIAEKDSGSEAEAQGSLEWDRPAGIPRSELYPQGLLQDLEAIGAG
jgi:hypothetical protein